MVADDWALKPDGLGAGDQFRLIFLSSSTRNASSSNIAHYNTFVQDRAAAGHSDIQDHSDDFRVVGCTAAVDARDNTATTYTTSDKGVPIYWLDGNKVADDYEDFYDGSWDDEASLKNELGGDQTLVNSVFTGCGNDGTELITSGISRALGSSNLVALGMPGSHSPINSGLATNRTAFRPFYGLSGVFQVAAGTSSVSVTIEAEHETIGGGLEHLKFTLTREGATTAALDATVTITQDEDWLDSADLSHEVTFAVDSDTATLEINALDLSFEPTVSGVLTATVSGSGVSGGSDEVTIVSIADPPVTVSFDMTEYNFAEDATDPAVHATAKLDAAYPRKPSIFVGPVTVKSVAGTAKAFFDYATISETVYFDPDDFARDVVDDPWEASTAVPGFAIVNDDVYEGSQEFTMELQWLPGLSNELVRFAYPDGTTCEPSSCSPKPAYSVTITDEEDKPVLSLSASAAEIAEEDDDGTTNIAENASVVTVATTNSKTFADEQTLTLNFSGAAVEDTHFTVTPADADPDTEGHQVALPAQTASVEVTVTAAANNSTGGPRTTTVTGSLDGEDIGSADIKILEDDTVNTNTQATGLPLVTGVPQVGGTLTATKGDIDDDDGLPTTTFPDGYTFQWVRVAGSTETDISGETSSTYELAAADAGNTVKVKVSFTDGAGFGETLTSAAAGPVLAAAEDCSTDRTGNDWCTTLTVADRAGVGGLAYGFRSGGANDYGTLDDPDIVHGTISGTVNGIWIWDARPGTDTVVVQFDGDRAPHGTVFDLGGTEFTASAATEHPSQDSRYRWDRPTDFTWVEGQTVTVSANLPPVVASAAVNGTALTLTYIEALDETSTPAASAYTVKLDGSTGPVVSSVAVSGSAVTLTLATAVASTDTDVTVDYTAPSSSPVRDESEINAPGFTDEPVTNNTVASTNSGATGQPDIGGFPQVGQTLTAEQGDMADADTLPTTTFPDGYTFQWVRVDSSNNETDISGETSRTYEPTAAHVGSTFKVKVAFTDGGGNAETLTSDATAAVLAAPEDCDTDRTGNDWCATMTVGTGFKGADPTSGFNRSSAGFGMLDDQGIEYGASFDADVDFIQITEYFAGHELEIALGETVPHGTVFDLGGTEFTVASNSEISGSTIQWDRPAGFAWLEGQKVTVSAELGNFKAKRKPGITGTATVGEVLTANVDNVTDTDGLPTTFPDDYTFQWSRVDADGTSNRTEISGETSDTYTLTADDEGKRIVVEVGFTDKDSNDEGPLASDPYPTSGTVKASFVCTAPDFSGRTEVWTATLTVGMGTVELGYSSGDYGELPVTDFDFGRSGYTVEAIYRVYTSSNREILVIDLGSLFPSTDLSKLRLHVCGESLRLDETSFSTDIYGWQLSDVPAALDWSDGDMIELALSATNNTVPVLDNAIPDQVATAGTLFDYPFPANAFSDADGDALNYTATLSNGDPLPTWLSFTDSTRTFSGTPPPADVGALTVKVTAADNYGGTVSDEFDIEVSAEPDPMPTYTTVATVDADWSLIPDGLGPGDEFRLIFATSTTRNASSTNIADYNTFVQNRAAAGHSAIQDHFGRFRVVGCTAAVDARDNTATTYTTSDPGVPIYWLNGNKVADDYEDFYDGSWNDEANPKNESGNDRTLSGSSNHVLTGCRHDGTEFFSGGIQGTTSNAFGTGPIIVGIPNSSTVNNGPISSTSAVSVSSSRPFYGLSGVFRVLDGTAATGQPEILGTPQVGQALKAGVLGITDDDGLPTKTFPAGYSFQWVRVTGGTETEVGTDNYKYTPVEADVGSAIRVDVSLTDGVGNPEGPFSSAPTAAVVAEAEDCDADRPGNDWCATMTVGVRSGTARVAGFKTPSISTRLSTSLSTASPVLGRLADATIDYGRNPEVRSVFMQDAPGGTDNDFVEVELDGRIPRGTVFDLGGRAFATGAGSALSHKPGAYQWPLPAGFAWLDGQEVTVSANLAPMIVDAVVDGTSLVLTYEEDLDTSSTPAADSYAVEVDDSPGPTVSSVSVATRTVTLTLASAVASTDVDVWVSYTVPSSSPLRDVSGLDAPAVSYIFVTNDTDTTTDTTRTQEVAEGLTASFANVPGEHEGAKFPFEVHFSEAFKVSYLTMREDAFTVTNGRVKRARRIDNPHHERNGLEANRMWRITVEPDGNGDVTVELPVTTDCAATGAVCTDDGRGLSIANLLVVKGPAGLSVADAEAEEGTDPALAFAVTLDRARTEDTTVDYATSDGTATAGSDYTAKSGTLTFAPGETSKTVLVPVIDDAHDEDKETMTLTLSNPSGAYLADAEATGTITNTDLMPQAWLARFGRTVAEQVIDSVDERMRAAPRPGAQVTLAGQRLGGGSPDAQALEEAEEKARLEEFSDWLRGEACRDARSAGADCPAGGSGTSRALTGRDLLMGSSFALTGGSPEGGYATLWGRGALTRFDGREGELTLSGEVTGALLGTDWTRERFSAGLVLSHARGEGSYRQGADSGEVASTLTGLYPWGRGALSDRVTAWGAAGYGAGTLTLTPESGEALKTDMNLAMAAAGLRGVVVEAPAGGGPELAVKTDALAVRTSSDAVEGAAGGNFAASTAGVTRLRLGLEGTWRGLVLGTGTLEPRLELGVRHDGGDAETGFGLDLGGGVAWSDPATGFRAEASGRGLLTHESAGFRQRGFAGRLGWDPRPDSSRGPSLTLTQSVGVSARGGADALLGRRTLTGLAANDDSDELANRRFEMKLGYGFAVFGDRYTSTPQAGLGWSPSVRETVLGWRLAEERGAGLVFGLDVEGARREPAHGDSEAAHRLGLGLGWRLEGAPGTAFEFRVEGARLEAANDEGGPEHRLGLRLTARW